MPWIGTPIVSALLGFVLPRLIDAATRRGQARQPAWLRDVLLAGCYYAAYTLGANNTGNAVGMFYGLKLFTPVKAGLVGGIVMAIGAMTRGKRILEKVGKETAEIDVNVGIGAKLAQSITAHVAALSGYPTSMNQALIGGVAGAGATKGCERSMARRSRRSCSHGFLRPCWRHVCWPGSAQA